MRKQFATEVNGLKCETVELSWEEGAEVTTRIARVLGAGTEGSAPIAAMLRALSKDDIVFLVKLFGKYTTVESEGGKKPYLKDLLAGEDERFGASNFGTLLRIVGWCLEVNLKDFFQQLGLDAMVKKARERGTLPSLKDAIGQSLG